MTPLFWLKVVLGNVLKIAAIAGYLDEALRMSGARAVDVRLASSVALGDDLDEIEATWASA